MCAVTTVAPTIDMGRDMARRELNARYLDYLNDNQRRLRKQAGSPTNDAAGLLRGAKFHGRGTPLKGRGLAPVDHKESEAASTRQKAHVPGLSWQPTDVLQVARPTTADSVLYRPSKRIINHSYATSLSGSAVAVAAEAPMLRRIRGEGAASPDRSISLTKKHIINEGYSSGEQSSEDHYGRRTAQLIRPATAGVDSLIRHRYSLPDTTPSRCSLDSVRVAAPTTLPFNETASRDSFYDALTEYAYNKSRATFGNHFKLG